MRDQYAGDVSDALKFALLRALAADDRKLGIAWYYAPGDDGRPDGRHMEWLEEPTWQSLDAALHGGITALTERSIAALELAPIWPAGSIFYREPICTRPGRFDWSERKRFSLETADLIFLDPDNGIGPETEKHATLDELRLLRSPGRAIVFITFPGRRPHADILRELHDSVLSNAGAQNVVTLRTNVSVPARKPGTVVQRQRWFSIMDADHVLLGRARDFVARINTVRRVSATLVASGN